MLGWRNDSGVRSLHGSCRRPELGVPEHTWGSTQLYTTSALEDLTPFSVGTHSHVPMSL